MLTIPMAKSVDRRPVSISFKEKLLSLGGLGFLVSHEEEDDIVSGWRGFFAKKNVEMESADSSNGARKEEDRCNDPLSKYPVLSMTEAQYTAWCKPWMNSLIVKVLGLPIPKYVLFDRVRRMWKPQQPLKVVPLSNDYYIVSFSNKEDRDYAFSEGPWMIDDHYLLVQRWRPNFNPWSADRHRKIAVWVRIPDLRKEFCTVESLGLIGNMIGKIVKIDRSTSIYEKGGVARICVEIDLQSPLLPAFRVFGEDKQLVYEGLHLVCFGCGKYGHERVVCPDREVGDEGPEQQVCSNGSEGKNNQAPTDGPIENDERSTVAGVRKEAVPSTMAATAVHHRSDEGMPVGIKAESGKEKQRNLVTRQKKVAEKPGQAHRLEVRVGIEGSSESSREANRTLPTVLVSGELREIRPTRSGRRDFLGPHMLLRRDFRRGLNGLEMMGGGNGGHGVKNGIVQDMRGNLTRVSRDLAEGSRGDIQKGINQLRGGGLKKSNVSIGPSEKPKSEWVMVGSKRKKEDKLKVFGKENRVNDRPKFKIKEAIDKGAHFEEITNQYSSLPEEDITNIVQSEVVISDKSASDPLSAVMVDDEMGVGNLEPDSGLGTDAISPSGSGLARTSLTLS
ncbi:hypothetical protein K1719_035137 [Acacia pycnantha]|nr:hypothetical protein K1719_035137 [Acacia pycnantha]